MILENEDTNVLNSEIIDTLENPLNLQIQSSLEFILLCGLPYSWLNKDVSFYQNFDTKNYHFILIFSKYCSLGCYIYIQERNKNFTIYKNEKHDLNT